MADELEPPPLDYDVTNTPSRPRIWLLAVAIPLPTLLEVAYITAVSWPIPRNESGLLDWLALLFAIGVGIRFIAAARLRPQILLGVALLYFILQIGWLVIFGINFACDAFGRCP